jgi:hypothetical protein
MTLTTAAICSAVIHHRSPSGQHATTLNSLEYGWWEAIVSVRDGVASPDGW